MLFPGSVAGFHCASVIDPDDDEVARLQHLWCGLEESRVWGRYVKAAAEGNHDMMKKLPGVVVMLDCQAKTLSADGAFVFDKFTVKKRTTTHIPYTYQEEEEEEYVPGAYEKDEYIPDTYEVDEYSEDET